MVGVEALASPLDKIFRDEVALFASLPASLLGNVVHVVVAPPSSRSDGSKVELVASPLSRMLVRGQSHLPKLIPFPYQSIIIKRKMMESSFTLWPSRQRMPKTLIADLQIGRA